MVGLFFSVRQVLNYCKWLFVSNLIGLVIVYADRLIVVAKFDHHEVSAYMIPMEIVARSMIIVSALVTVIFPSLIDRARVSRSEILLLVERLKSLVTQLTLASTFLIFPFIDMILAWWMGAEMVGLTRQVVIIGLIGVAVASSSIISMMGINSLGHTRQIAFLHIVELLLLLGLLYLAAKTHSLWMVQTAWIARLFFDNLGMNFILKSLNSDEVISLRYGFIKSAGIIISNIRSTFPLLVFSSILIGLSQFDISSSRLIIICCSLSIAFGIFVGAFHNAIQLKRLFGNTISHSAIRI